MGILDNNTLQNYWENGKCWYAEGVNIFYFPETDEFYNRTKEDFISESDSYFPRKKLQQFMWRDVHGCYHDLPNRKSDQRVLEDVFEKEEPSDKEIINFLKIGPMSTCNKTDNTGRHAKVHWENQVECTFSEKSLADSHCMHWRGQYNGHCSCESAYMHRQGIPGFKLPQRKPSKKWSEKYFEEAEQIGVRELSKLYTEGTLILARSSRDTHIDIFYLPRWNVYFNGKGKFLRMLTVKQRKEKKSWHELPKDIPDFK